MNPLDRLLVTMRVGLHVMAAFLLGFGALTAAYDGHLSTLLPASILGVIYLAGTVWERRHLGDPFSTPWPRLGWLLAVLLCWSVLTLTDAAYVWLLFPLTFIIAAVLPTVAGIVMAVAAWGIAALSSDASPAALLGPAMGVAVALGCYHLYRQLVAQARHHREVAERLRRTQDQLLLAEREAGQLAERERLSREIHDTVAQALSSIVLLSRAARTSLRQGEQERATEQLATIAESAAEGLGEARRLVRELAAPTEADLPTRLRQLGEGAQRRQAALGHQLLVDVVCDPAGEVPGALVAPLARVAQEGLSNIERHAHAQHARLTLGVWPDAITLDIFDDGQGIAGAPEGFGLRGLRARVAELAGDVTLDSAAGGTVLAVRVPWKGAP